MLPLRELRQHERVQLGVGMRWFPELRGLNGTHSPCYSENPQNRGLARPTAGKILSASDSPLSTHVSGRPDVAAD